MISDDELLAAFADTTLPPAALGHREHLRLGFLHLVRHGFDDGAPRFVAALRRYVTAHNVVGKYHATLTWAYLALIGELLASDGEVGTFDAFAARHADLFDQRTGAIARAYGPALLTSELARRAFVLPTRLHSPIDGQ